MTAFAHESKTSKYNHKPLAFSHLTLTAQLLGRVALEHHSAFLVCFWVHRRAIVASAGFRLIADVCDICTAAAMQGCRSRSRSRSRRRGVRRASVGGAAVLL